MKFQDLASNTITITDFRRDVDIFVDAMARDGEVVVTKNNDVMFVAYDPARFSYSPPRNNVAQVVQDIKNVRDSSPKNPKISSTHISDMRDARISRWKK